MRNKYCGLILKILWTNINMTKIALCFLTYDNLSQPKLWRNIIDNNKNKINVYIHNKNDFVDKKYNLHQYCIKNKLKETKWGDISLVKATLLLFKEALKCKENSYFILLSDKCIPLYNFNYIYNHILKTKSNIISCIDRHKERFNKLKNKIFFNKKQFMKQSQWMVLERSTAHFFTEENFTDIFGNDFFAPDEHYFINICIKFNIPYVNQRITYTNFTGESKTIRKVSTSHPKTYLYLSNDKIKEITENKSYFFMRKISPRCILPSYFNKIC
jgi:Core-2/I-Branching enzyme